MTSTRVALFFSTLNGYLSSLISLISAMVLARMLTPKELGLLAIASSTVIIADILKNAGMSSVIIREQSFEEEDFRRALGVTVCVSFALGLVVLFISVPVSIFYALPELKYLLMLMAVPFFITPFYANCFSIYAKKMKQRVNFKISSITLIGSLVITLYLVVNGFSYYAIPLGAIVQSILFLVFVSQNREPEFVFRPTFKGMSHFFKAGLSLIFINVLNRYLFAINDLILGKIGSVRGVAIYSRGVGLADYMSTMLTMGVASFALPYLSQAKHAGQSLEEDYYTASIMTFFVTVSGLLFASIFANELILVVFGEQWVESIPIAESFCLFLALRFVVPFFNQVLIVDGQEGILICFLFILFISIMGNIYINYDMGLAVISKNMIWIGSVSTVFQLVILRLVKGYQIRRYVFKALPSAAVVLIGAAVGLLCRHYIEATSKLVLLVVSAGCVGATLFVCSALLNLIIYDKLVKGPLLHVAKVFTR